MIVNMHIWRCMMVMNNKGFAITTILYGSLVLFCLLLVSLLGILSMFRSNLQLLIENGNGARKIATVLPQNVTSYSAVTKSGLYCVSSSDCKYISNSDLAPRD